MASAIVHKVNKSIDDLAQTLWNHHQTSPSSKRTLVSISGIPGSGKSTLARHLAERLNSLYLKRKHRHHDQVPQPGSSTHADLSNPSPRTFAIDVSMDGFHLSRAQLRALPDAVTAMHRRGAAFTYDAAGYCQLVEQLARPVVDDGDDGGGGGGGTVQEGGGSRTIYAPAFDHATKDPVKDSVKIFKETKIVILEGNYVNLDREPWRAVAMLFDVKLIVSIDKRVAMERLVKRHLISGICVDDVSARQRAEGTDALNAEDILHHVVEGVRKIDLEDDSAMES